MKKLILSFLVITFGLSLSAQEYVKMMQDPNANFYDVQEAFYDYWGDEEPSRGLGWKQFKRWENFMEARVYPSGEHIPSQPYYNSWQQAQEDERFSSEAKDGSEWVPLGPTSWESQGWNPGLGRVNMVVRHPSNDDILYVGTPAGGLWKSEDAGITWTPLTDNLPSIGVSGLAINPDNPDIMYLATGDGDGGDTYSLGVLKTTNGGVTWESTGLSSEVSQNERCSKILMHPTNFEKLWVATTDGLYVTTNGGTEWAQALDEYVRDLEINPSNPDIVMTSGNRFYRSTNGGSTFVQVTEGLAPSNETGRLAIAVTEANSDFVYLLATNNNNGFYGLYQSTDGGVTFTEKSNSPNVLTWSQTGEGTGGQGWYDLAIAASHVDADEIYVGGINVWRSNTAGTDWEIISHWNYPTDVGYTHADIHSLDVYGGDLFCGSDGGVFISENEGNDWTDLSEGLQITQYYRVAVSTTDPNLVLTASQDNGTNLFSNGTDYVHLLGGDGNMALIDYNNDQIMYSSYPGGSFQKSVDGGQSFSGFNDGIDENGAWVTPLKFHPTNPDILFSAYENVFKNTNGTWTQLGTMPGSGTLRSLAVAPSDANVIYTATQGNIYKTTDGGVNWENISSSLPNQSITDIEVDPDDSDRLWVTFSGYSQNSKVYTSINGGNNWSNLSTGLPNLPVNCITYQTGSNDGIYAGTDAGVYYRNDQSSEWIAYNEALPNVIVNQIVLHYGTNQIYLCTYGRGVWTNEFSDAASVLPIANFTSNKDLVCENESVIFSNTSLNDNSNQWTFEGGDPAESSNNNVSVDYPNQGVYSVKLLAINENGADSIIREDFIVVQSAIGQSAPVQEGFEETDILMDAGWVAINEDDYNEWVLNTSVGFYSEHCASLANYGNTALNEDFLLSPTYDLTPLDTAIISFRVAYTRRPGSGSERLKVEISTDCGESWEFKKLLTSPNMETVPATDDPFTPASPEEWMLVVVDNIEADELTENFSVRFTFRSNEGNNIYIDNINIAETVVTSTEELASFKYAGKLYPNPIVDQTATFEIEVDQDLQSTIVMTDVLGKRVATLWNGNVASGKNTISLNIPELASGYYNILMLSKNGEVQSSTPVVLD